MDWADFISKVGFPGAFSLALIYAIAKAGKWAAPRADKFLDGHNAFLSGLEERDRAQTECLRVLSEETKRHREMVTQHMASCELIHRAHTIDTGAKTV